MIYSFSGTGNSRLIARTASKLLDEAAPIAIDRQTVFRLPEASTEPIGFVFPVYAWGMPKIVADFIARIPHRKETSLHPFVYAILTHGDDIGRTDRLLRQALQARGYNLSACYSLAMRNTYVCLPGFDIDSQEVAHRKQQEALRHMPTIVERIRREQPSTPADVTPGAMPDVKSYLIRPLFNACLISDNRFGVDTTRCTGCGRCANTCPLSNIRLGKEGYPKWLGDCTHCLACYHCCPNHAINYGKSTVNKGQVEIIF